MPAPNGEYVAWADSRSGIFQIDVAQLTASGWQSLGSLALGGAIVATAGASINPSIALGADGEPVVAWTVLDGSSSDIYVAQYDPAANGGAGGWDSLGDSLAPAGISGTGAADDAQVVETTSSGLVVAYRDRSGGVGQCLCQAVQRRAVGRVGQRRRQRRRHLAVRAPACRD